MSVSAPGLFAVGECAVVAAAPRPASGVWAERAAPLLALNLQASLERPQRPLRPWRPQPRALQLLGDGGWSEAGPRAVALWGPWALGPSPWLWRWKRQLDHRFLKRLNPASGASGSAAAGSGPEAMACRGCAAKLAAAPLQAALARLGGAPPAPEDASLVAITASGEALLQSVDGFPALVADPWLNARLTTLHACGDLWASGAAVASAQALVTLPEADAALQEEWLLHTLAGVRSVLDPLSARLLGGHTLEGRDGAGLALALSVNGLAPAGRHWAKGPLRPGDALLLAGPLGSGVLFAAAMAGAARPEWIDAALARMQRSQAELVPILAAHGCHACTDVTGFGLLGHLGEMLALAGEPAGGPAGASPALVVHLEGAALPAHAGALTLLAQGWASSLAPANAQALALLEGPVRLRAAAPGAAERQGPVAKQAVLQEPVADPAALRALLVDPQTCGPLLAALPAAQAPAALAALQQAGFADAALIGRVRAAQEPAPSGAAP
jgi:selenide,water dikinase